jgi:hypothetical protein
VTVVEQRQRERARVWLPIRLRSADGDALGVTYDASEQGVLMLTASALAVGTRVSLTFEVPGAAPKELVASGQVVRAAPNLDDPDGLWPHRVAVVLDEPMAAFHAELEALALAHPLQPGK